MAVGGSGVITGCPGERARDYPAYSVFARHYVTCLAADIIEFIYGDHVFVCRYLKDAVCGSVDYESACLHVLVAVVTYDLGAAIRLVAKDVPACRLLEP